MIKYISRKDLGKIAGLFSIVITVTVPTISILDCGLFYYFGAIVFCLLLSVLITGIYNYSCKRIIIDAGKSSIIVEYGDIMNCNGVIVIPFNRSFDTLVDEHIVSKNTLHGKFISQYYSSDISNLENNLKEYLDNYNPKEKDERKRHQYPPGKIIPISTDDKKFLLLALSTFDEDYHASLEFEDYFIAICSLMRYADVNCQGADIYMPVIGGGLSRLPTGLNNLLELQIGTIKAMGGLKCGGDVRIIILEDNRDKVCLSHLKV